MRWNGAILKTLVQERGVPLVKLAKSLGVSRQTVNDWTKGHIPRGSHLVKLSNMLNVNPGYFFPNEAQEQISVPLHRKRGVAKVTSAMEQASLEMAKQYENMFKSVSLPGLLPVLRVTKGNEKGVSEMASQLRTLAAIDADKPIDYEHCFGLLEKLKIIIILRFFPQTIKDYAFYCKIWGHRVVFVDNKTNLLDLIFPLLHETIHALRDEIVATSYEIEEEHFCDGVANHVQFPDGYVDLVYKTIAGRPESHEINLLKEFSSINRHSIFGIAERLKKKYPPFKLNVGGANSNLRKEFSTIGDILFGDSTPKCYVQNLKTLAPLFFNIVSTQINNISLRKLGELLSLENILDAKEVYNEWKRTYNCN